MTKRFLMNSGLTFSLSLLALILGCGNLGEVFKAKCERSENVSVPIKDTTELYVETYVGSITVTGADVSDCSITAEITVKARTEEQARELAEQVRIELEPSAQKLTIRAGRPEALKKRSLVVNFTITAPEQLNLNCSAHVGAVEVSDIEGQITASTNVGSITCKQVVADIDLGSNVGSMEVEYSDAAPADCNANIATNMGSIKFAGPAQISAQLSASTNVGTIETAKPITLVGKIGKSVRGTIGSGDGKVTLKTNVGSIEIE